jgi:hypothetical protein
MLVPDSLFVFYLLLLLYGIDHNYYANYFWVRRCLVGVVWLDFQQIGGLTGKQGKAVKGREGQ